MPFIRYLRTYGVVALLILATTSSALAADNSPAPAATTQLPDSGTTAVELNKDYFTGYLTDTLNILTSPARWSASDWLEAAAVTGVAVGLYTQDEQIKTWFQKHSSGTYGTISDDAKKIGTFSVPVLVGLGAYGYIAPDDKAKTTFLLSAESFLITGAFVEVLKYSTGRHRPFTGDPHDTWSGYTTNGDYQSFPSGDAASAFSIASVVASEYDNMIVPPLVYAASALIDFERLHENAHWASDVFVGSAIGYFTGKAVVASHTKQRNLSFAPYVDGKDKGVLMTYRF
ncbi:MAG TPA: phosphatase PAP2 family protein [Nitrospirota bacterium]|nr:phosphatase PAP2 family protein [Nitrospirota bacterium]